MHARSGGKNLEVEKYGFVFLALLLSPMLVLALVGVFVQKCHRFTRSDGTPKRREQCDFQYLVPGNYFERALDIVYSEKRRRIIRKRA